MKVVHDMIKCLLSFSCQSLEQYRTIRRNILVTRIAVEGKETPYIQQSGRDQYEFIRNNLLD